MSEEIKFFSDPLSFRKWLQQNHSKLNEQWVGFYKKGTGIPSITWPQSVDQALCFGWIDGLRKSIDDASYKIRFTPRRSGSNWSAKNLQRIEFLTQEGLMKPAGLQAYAQRDHRRAKQASYQQMKIIKLAGPYQQKLKNDADAWQDFRKRTPSYRKQCTWWIMSAKREETRIKRLDVLIESCKKGVKIPPLRWQK